MSEQITYPLDLQSIVDNQSVTELQLIMDKVVDIASQAAERIINIYLDDRFDIQLKSDRTPVTQADLQAHHLIVDKLQQLTGDIPILSEESASYGWQQRKLWQLYWLIDPLDGTQEFIDKNGEFTVNIALISNGKPIMGIVQAPVLGEVYFAATGIGAFKTSATNNTQLIKVRQVPQLNGQAEFIVAIGRGCISEQLKKFYLKLSKHKTIRLGSSLKTCLIAEGKADVYPRFGKTSEWDTAAAQCILECAGGLVSDMQLSPLKYNTKDSLLNPEFIAYGDKTISWSNYLT